MANDDGTGVAQRRAMRMYVGALGIALIVGCQLGPTSADFSGPDECTPAGGTCGGECPRDTHHYSTESCPGFLSRSGCCMPGADLDAAPAPRPPAEQSSGTSGEPPPLAGGKCNGGKCAPGCVCRPFGGASGSCTSICDCTGLADAGLIGDGGADESVSCGVIGCSTRCSCASPSGSTCVCGTDDCH